MNLPKLGLACDKCREPFTFDNKITEQTHTENLLCTRCQKGKRAFDDCVIALQYASPVAEMLQRMKYSGHLSYVKPLTEKLTSTLEAHYADSPWPQALIPVPMHWWKLRKRGFNQADILARHVGKQLSLPVLSRSVTKSYHKQAQMSLNAKKRRQEIRGGFRIRRPIPFRHVAIVDDVMTTGATAEELCHTLRSHGTEQIDIWCIARTPPYS
ncbi:ComF family protein [Parendozoicomonas haliclonae]|nr:ComF family protein [Parendozoicomonas haliclonae]